MGKRKSFGVPHVVVVAVAMIHNDIQLQDVAHQKDRNNSHSNRLKENI